MKDSAPPVSARTAPAASRLVRWAWPDAALHLLVFAATSPDEDRAFDHFLQWLHGHDLDQATHNEHRLLSAIVERFSSRLSSLPEYPRLIGLQRLNWTKSRMTVRDVRPVLQSMVEAGLTLILMKGAGRVAKEASEQKSRTAYDVDILVSGAEFEQAFNALMQNGWQSNRGESEKNLRARLPSLRDRNFVKGKFGDIDLHRWAYPRLHSHARADVALLQNLESVQYYGLPLFVPCAEERLAMAIGHAGWEADSHSDWLIDCARIITTEDIGWEQFLTIVKQRRLRAKALIAMSYLYHSIGLPVPEATLNALSERGPAGVLRTAAGVLVRKEATSLAWPLKALRYGIVAIQQVSFERREKAVGRPRYFGWINPAHFCRPGEPLQTSWPLSLPQDGQAGAHRFHLVIEAKIPAARRRIEFEINTEDDCLSSLFTLSLRKKSRLARVSFWGRVDLSEASKDLELEARPGKVIYGMEPQPYLDKYQELRFRIVRFSVKPLDRS